MYQDYLNDIVEHYNDAKKQGRLPQRLIQPTPGGIKAECLVVCEARLQSKDLRVLFAFFRTEVEKDAMFRTIHRCDRDRFKPLVNFLRGVTSHTDDLNIELLAWLLDYPNRPFKAGADRQESDEKGPTIASAQVESEVPGLKDVATNGTDDGIGTTTTEFVEVRPVEDGYVTSSRWGTLTKWGAVVLGLLFLAVSVFYILTTRKPTDAADQKFSKSNVVANLSDSGNSAGPPRRQTLLRTEDTPDSKMVKEPASRSQKQPGKHLEDAPEVVRNRAADAVISNMKSPAVDFSTFTNTQSDPDIALVVIDDNGQQTARVASVIGNLYRAGRSYIVSTSVFTSAFLSSKYFSEMVGGDASVLSKLAMSSSLKYIVVGRYSSRIEKGQMTNFICRANLDVVVIDAKQKIQVDGFNITVANGYDDEDHARAGAIEKMIDQYRKKSTSIKLE